MKSLFLLLILLFTEVSKTWSHTTQTGSNLEKQYLSNIEHQFNRQNFDSCIYYSYLLANQYDHQKDITKLTDIWYSISYLYLLQDMERDANISLNMARHFQTSRMLFKKKYEALYQGINDYHKSYYSKALIALNQTNQNMLPASNRRFNKLVQLYLDNAMDQGTLPEKNFAEVNKYLSNLKLAKDTNWFGYPLALFYLGKKYYYSDKIPESIHTLQKCITNYERMSILNLYWIKAYSYIIYGYNSVSDLNSSEICFKRITSKIEKRTLSPSEWFEYNYLKAKYLNNQSNYQEALDIYLNIYHQKKDRQDYTDIIENIIFNNARLLKYNQIIEWYAKTNPKNLHNYTKIIVAHSFFELGSYQKSIQMISSIETTLKLTDPDILSNLSWLSDYYTHVRNYIKAEKFSKIYLSIAIKKYGKHNIYTLYAYDKIAYLLWFGKSDYYGSLNYYNKELYALITNSDTLEICKVPDISKSMDDQNLENVINNKAECLYQVSRLQKIKSEELRFLKASLDYFELSLFLIQKNKMLIPFEDQQFVYADLKKRKYPNIIKVCLELYHKTGEKIFADKGFEYAEKSMASLLLSMVRGVTAQHLNLVPDHIIETEEKIRVQSALVTKERTEEYNLINPDYGKIVRLNNTLLKLKDGQDSVTADIKQKYKSYYNLKYNAEVVNTATLQKILAKNEAIIQYSVTWDFMAIFVLTHDDFKIFTDTLDKAFFEDVEKYRQCLNGFDYTDVSDTFAYEFAKVSNRLYNHLIKPANQYIKEKKILVIPDDVLNQIPFEPLVAQIPDKLQKKGFKDFDYLIRHHQINYCFSTTLFSLNHQRTTFNNTNFLAVAPKYLPIENKHILGGNQETRSSDLSQFSILNGTYKEVKELCSLFHGTALIKDWATKERFIKVAGRYDVLHLAMHGVINNESPMFSKLIFSPGKNSVSEGFLNTYEIYNMHINAPLVVLSACNTGSGKLHTGEGIISLARSLFTAGAKCVVMTLWSVADKSSSHLMKLFYRHLRQKETVGEAMQNAKLDYLKGSDKISSHPYFWAGYISTGNAEVSFEEKKNYSLWYILTIVLSMMIVLLFLIYKYKQTK